MPVKFSAILYFILISDLFTQINPGARQISLANSDVALSNDVFAVFNNPAGPAQLNWREIGIYYSPAPFGLKELANGYAAYNEPLPFGSIGAGFMTYGFELYRENKLYLLLSGKLKNNLLMGLSLTYHNLSISKYGSDNAFSLNIGGLAYLRKFLRWGFYYTNLLKATYGGDEDQIPSLLNTGFSYEPLDAIILNAAVEKKTDTPLSVRFGIEYSILNWVILRGGFSTEPDRFTAGIGLAYSYFELDYSVFNHQDLGLTHQAGIIISFIEPGSRSKRIKEHLGLTK